jgi:Tol biopolymer transport system component
LVDAGQYSDDQLQLWRVSYPGGRVQRVTNDMSDYQRITQTSDARTVLAVRNVHEADLWLAPPNNPGAAVPVSAGDLHNLNSADVGPDGRLYFSASSGDARDIWTMSADGKGRRQISSGPSSKDEVAISRDGRQIVYQSDGRIWQMNADGSGARQLTGGPLDVHPTFSSDGRWIVYTSFANWSPGIGGQPSLWRVPASGGPAEQLTHDSNSMADVSPDDKWIAAAYYRYDRPAQAPAIAIYPFSGGAAVKMIERPAGAGSSVFWSADGKTLDYIVTSQGVENIWRQSVDGGPPTAVSDFHTGSLFFFRPPLGREPLLLARGKDIHDLVLIRGIH